METGGPEAEVLSIKMQFVEMHQILEALTSRNLEPALKWVSKNRERLKECGSDLELRLCRLQFMQIFQKRGRMYLLNNVKEYLSPSVLPMHEIQKLLGLLLWPDRLERSCYDDLIDPNKWEKASEELKRVFCNVIIGQSMENPLTVTLAAGVVALPALLKLADQMSAEEWDKMKCLPVALELLDEFHFH